MYVLLYIIVLTILQFHIHVYSITTTNSLSYWETRDKNDYTAFSFISDYLESTVNELRNDPELGQKIRFFLNELVQKFSGKRYANTFLRGLVIAAKTFADGGYYISPEIVVSILKKAANHYNKKPHSIGENLSHLSHESMKTVANTIENVGSVLASSVRLVKDLHSSQADYTNAISEYIPLPYFSNVVQGLNKIIYVGLEISHLLSIFAVKNYGKQMAERLNQKKLEYKKDKLNRLKTEILEQKNIEILENKGKKPNKEKDKEPKEKHPIKIDSSFLDDLMK